MRRTSAAFLAALSLAAFAGGCGRNENAQGTPEGEAQSLEERAGDEGTAEADE